MRLIDCEQHSLEWFAARCGIVTASRLKDAMATLKNGDPAQARKDYVLELVTERLTGQAFKHYETAAMQHGTEHEPAAREAYEVVTGSLVDQVGFARHDAFPFGASPDGFVGDDGAIEIKCPFDSRVSLKTRLEGMPAEHMPQVQGVLYVTGRKYCDFISYDPRLPVAMRLYVQTVPALPEWREKIEAAIDGVESEIKAITEKLLCPH